MDWSTISLPSMGEGVHEATIVKWLKKKSEPVQEGEPLVEVSTDKVDTEIVAEKSGFLLATYAGEGDIITVGQLIACLGKSADTPLPNPGELPGAKAATPKPKAGSVSQEERAAPLPSFSSQETLRSYNPLPSTFSGPVKITPLARNLAKRLGVSELGRIAGSGQGGKITRRDIIEFQNQYSGSPSAENRKNSSEFDPTSELFRQKIEAKDGKEFLQGVEVKREKMSKVRKLTADHMMRSVRISPHVTTTFEMNLSRLAQYKKELGAKFEQNHGLRLTYTAFFIAFAARCLEEYPQVNASIDGDDILLRQQINIGCAVAVDTELVVPVIRNAAGKGLVQLTQDLDGITKAARNRKLAPSDIVGGTFTLTNPGMYGSLHSQPIINQPQVAILSIGSIVKSPWVDPESEKISVSPLCQIGLTFDHRVIDGRMGAMFLRSFEELVANPQVFPL